VHRPSTPVPSAHDAKVTFHAGTALLPVVAYCLLLPCCGVEPHVIPQNVANGIDLVIVALLRLLFVAQLPGRTARGAARYDRSQQTAKGPLGYQAVDRPPCAWFAPVQAKLSDRPRPTQ